MTAYRGHYLPVAARLKVLRVYRDRRTRPLPMSNVPLAPIEAMRATVEYFQGWLASSVAYGFPKDTQALTDQLRAADYYLRQMYGKPQEFRWLSVVT